MQKRTHVANGLLLFSIYYMFYPLTPSTIWIIVASIFPDFDILPPFRMLHRFLLHNFLSTIVYSLIVAGMCLRLHENWLIIGLFSFSSYLLHLILDSLTKRGVGFLYPFNKRLYGLKITKTGSLLDKILYYLFVILTLVFLLKGYLGKFVLIR